MSDPVLSQVPQVELEARVAQVSPLVQSARAQLESLSRALSKLPHGMTVLDRDGVVLMAIRNRLDEDTPQVRAGVDLSPFLRQGPEDAGPRPKLLDEPQPFELSIEGLCCLGAPLAGARGPLGFFVLCSPEPANLERRALVGWVAERLTTAMRCSQLPVTPAFEPDASKLTAEQLRGWLAELLRQMPAGVVVADCRTGRIVLANRQAETLVRGNLLTSGVLSVANAAPHFNPRLPDGSPMPAERWPLVRALRGETINSEELMLRRLDGSDFVASISAGPVIDGLGRSLALVITIQDVSARHQAEREREKLHELERQARQEAEQQAQMRERLIAIVSHDLRQPLALVKLNLDALVDWPEDRAESLALARRGVRQMDSMISGLLDYHRCSNGTLMLSRRQVDLRAIAAAALEELRATSQGRIQLAYEGDCTGFWDADRLQQVLSNLVLNALRHGDPVTPVSVLLRSARDSVCLEVHNHGEPLPDAILREPFKAFQRGGRKGSGLGLGLYIVHEIVRAHEGSVEVRSSKEGGTRFLVTLPREP
jgi:signal transduction histidine kinase